MRYFLLFSILTYVVPFIFWICLDFLSEFKTQINAVVKNLVVCYANEEPKSSQDVKLYLVYFLWQKIKKECLQWSSLPQISFNKVADLKSATLLKKRLWHRCFPVNFAKFLRKSFLTEHLWWLILKDFRSRFY